MGRGPSRKFDAENAPVAAVLDGEEDAPRARETHPIRAQANPQHRPMVEPIPRVGGGRSYGRRELHPLEEKRV